MGLPAASEEIGIPLGAVALGLALGVGNIFIFYPLLLRFLPILRYYAPLHHRPISDIPGVPEGYDDAVKSAIMTLPDPNNFISAYSFLPLRDGVEFSCRMPKCRYYSVSLYAGLYDPVQDKIPPSLADHEIAHNADGSFDVVISEARPPAGDKGARNWLPSQGIRDGLLVIRRYGTLPGQLVECPAFRRRSDGALLKPAHRTYSGSHYAQANGNHRFARLVRVLRVMGLTFLGLLLSPMPLAHVNVAMAIAGMMPVGLNYLLYRVGRRRALAMRDAKTNGSIHKAIEPKIDFDSASARPHPQHKYFAVSFDTRQGDVVIKGRVLPRQQKYWDLCVYSVYGLPHFHYFTDETVVYTREGSSGDEGHEYEVVLTSCDPSAWVGQPNVVDVSGQPEGVVLVRLIFPASEESFQRSKPTVEVLAPRGGGRKSTGKGE